MEFNMLSVVQLIGGLALLLGHSEKRFHRLSPFQIRACAGGAVRPGISRQRSGRTGFSVVAPPTIAFPLS